MTGDAAMAKIVEKVIALEEEEGTAPPKGPRRRWPRRQPRRRRLPRKGPGQKPVQSYGPSKSH